jgi:quercetin dioxygenase-like cupin family protein
MKIIRGDEHRSMQGETFTGDVTLESVLNPQSEGGMSLSIVHFKDGARTHWHEHPGEQVLFVLEGEGRVGNENEQYTLKPGDVVHEGPGERHWHGAAPGKSMSHISITTKGSPTWFEAPEED